MAENLSTAARAKPLMAMGYRAAGEVASITTGPFRPGASLHDDNSMLSGIWLWWLVR